MYGVKPNLILGFHGCEADVCDTLLNNPDEVRMSQEPYDWLGHGVYFWENNYVRALQWANDKEKRGVIKKPAVIGAVLYLGYCCDFLDSTYIQFLQDYYEIMATKYTIVGQQLPRNKDLPGDKQRGKILRVLDCAVIEFMHTRISLQAQADIQTKGYTTYKNFDSTRGIFTEGRPAFDGAGIFEKSHVQICVRNLNCIKGFSELRTEHCSVLVRNLRFARLSRKEIEFGNWIEGSRLKSAS
jgi:hypothetical protein